jgi:iduronate 2-sulfatase
MMVHVPGLTDKGVTLTPYLSHSLRISYINSLSLTLPDKGVTTTTPTEFLDLFPTLAEAAAKKTIPPCPAGNSSQIALCTHGVSLLPLISSPDKPVKAAAYSQYPRGYVPPDTMKGELPAEEVRRALAGSPGPSPCLSHSCTMGYSMLTSHNGTEYRYTEWVDFNTKIWGKPDWSRLVGRELYDHSTDPMENDNAADKADQGLLRALSSLLRAHPVFGVQAVQRAQDQLPYNNNS